MDAKTNRQVAETIMEDIGKANADIIRNSFPNLPLRVLLQNQNGKLGVLVFWDGDLEDPDKVTYPNVHKVKMPDLRATEYGREKLRLAGR